MKVDPTASSSGRRGRGGTPEGTSVAAGVSIHLSIEKTEPLAGVAATAGRRPLPFVGWLELLRVVSELIGPAGQAEEAVPAAVAPDRLEADPREMKSNQELEGYGEGRTMNPLISAARQSVERELVITRKFDAPRELVFKAWTEPERLVRWAGPEGFTTVSSTMDVRPGGSYRACIRSREGADHWLRGTYREVVEPELLVFTFAWEDADGTPGREMLVSVSFAEEGGKTRMVFHQAVFQSAKDRAGRQACWGSSFNLLESYLQLDPTDETETRGYAAVNNVGGRASS